MITLTDQTYDDYILKNYKTPIFAMFTSKRCGPCKAMYPLIEAIENETPNEILFVKVDTDLSPNAVRNLKIQSVPTLIMILNSYILRRTGFLATKQEIYKFIQG